MSARHARPSRRPRRWGGAAPRALLATSMLAALVSVGVATPVMAGSAPSISGVVTVVDGDDCRLSLKGKKLPPATELAVEWRVVANDMTTLTEGGFVTTSTTKGQLVASEILTRSTAHTGSATVSARILNGAQEIVAWSSMRNKCAPPPAGDDSYVCKTYSISDAALARDAAAAAAPAGSVLVAINSAEENACVRAAITGIGYAWTGGTDATVEGEWRWNGGTQFWQGGTPGSGGVAIGTEYTNWYPAEEPSNSGDEDCAVINSGDGYWGDRSCAAEFRAIYEIG
jgi:hypothetical protein